MSPAVEKRIRELRVGLLCCSKAHRPVIQAMIDKLEAEQSIPERATAVDPEPKPPEAHAEAVEGAGSSSEAVPAERGSGSATSLSRTPGDTGTAGRAGEAGGSPAPQSGGGMAEPKPFPIQERSLAVVEPPATVQCGHCGTVIEAVSPNGRRRVYCDDRCRRLAGNERYQQALRERKEAAPVRPLPVSPPSRKAPARAPLSEDPDIAAWIAKHGVTRCPPAFVAPSQQGALDERMAAPRIAAFEAAREPTIFDVVFYLRRHGRKAVQSGVYYSLDGKRCSRTDLFRAANELRRAAGLTPYALPNALAGAA